MKQKLILAAHQCGTSLFYGMDDKQTAELESKLDKWSIEERRLFWGPLYLHGHLERLVGYDITSVVNQDELQLDECPSCNHPRPYTHLLLPEDGVYDVEVVGVSEPCIGYIWTERVLSDDGVRYETANNRGLICLASDGDAKAYARRKLAEKAVYI